MEVKNIAEYEENDSQLAKYTIAELHREIERLNNIIKEVKKYIEDTKKDNYKLVWLHKDKTYFEAGIEEILDKGEE